MGEDEAGCWTASSDNESFICRPGPRPQGGTRTVPRHSSDFVESNEDGRSVRPPVVAREFQRGCCEISFP